MESSREDNLTDIKSLTEPELSEYIKGLGEPAFRSGQIFSWIHDKMVTDPDSMTNLAKPLREKLSRETSIPRHEIVRIQKSKDGTQKFLFKLADGALIESVLMEYDYGYSVCVSTQSGCAMHCAFCASGMAGFNRNLTTSEILEEVYAIGRGLPEGKRISRLVFMGMGEPLLNYENVIKATRILCSEKGQNLSPRHITLSTCGIVPGILELAKEDLPITLALSLHAPTQELREKLMPVSIKYPLKEVMKATKTYRDITKRRVTYEYCLMGGINDSDREAENLSKLLRGSDGHINIIPFHKVENSIVKKGCNPLDFQKKLEKKGINVTIRRELGQDIDGACGQLSMKHKEAYK